MSIDFWTAKNYFGYIGIVASFIKDCKQQHKLIALRYAPAPHTSERIVSLTDSILLEFGIFDGILDNKIVSISTDNGANMRKAFDVSSMKQDATFNCNEDDDSNEECNEYESYEDGDETEQTISDDEFTSLMSGISKRIACVDHILNNNLKCSVNSDDLLSKTLNKLVKIARVLKYNGKVLDHLKKNNLQRIKLPPPTRWQYHYEMIESYKKLENEMPILCSIASIDNLTISETILINDFSKILQIYNKSLLKFQTRTCKLSDVIPQMLLLIIKLSEINTSACHIAKILKKDLLKRTAHIFEIQNIHFNKIYALATFLDPSTSKFLDISDSKVDAVKISDLKKIVISELSGLTTNAKDTQPNQVSIYSELEDLLELNVEKSEINRYFGLIKFNLILLI